MTWAVHVYDNVKCGNEKAKIHYAQTPTALWDKIRPYTFGEQSELGKNESFLPWPLVKCISIAADVPLLENNVIWMDNPGMRDINESNNEAARWALNQCDAIVVVHKHERCAASAILRQQIREAIRRARPGIPAVLVPTHSEQVDINANIDFSNEFNDEEKTLLRFFNEQTEQLRSEQRGNRDRDAREFIRFRLQWIDAQYVTQLLYEKVINQLSRRTGIKMGARNRAMTESYATLYPPGFPESQRQIFFIATSAWQAHISGYDPFNQRPISIEKTGFPDLVRYLRSMPSNLRASELTGLVRVQLPRPITTGI
ncbi:hypothetical protein EJ04DRAFT_523807 [Polyplosphaeria fusca]|uniref:Uncharacterized protein n=1 Tax=Polyplosphaeria fusca TaxID=682080 RepID=A0A9P4R032_9PLEO|nr:hypothetical protein EJ04DRAFT_523807 [Polyplosphaeria fusca]